MCSQRFDATTSDVNLGVNAAQAPTAQTILVLCYPIASGEGGFGYVVSRTPSASSSGPRLLLVNTNSAINFAGHSTGSASNPSRTAANNSFVYGQWQHIAAIWTGGLAAATSIQMYAGQNGLALTETAYGAAIDGVTAADSGSANSLHVGNREGTDRTFNGDIAYVAQWNRALSLTELLTAQKYGPLAVRGGLILYWNGARDLGPYAMLPKVLALTPGFTIPAQFNPVPMRPVYWRVKAPAVAAGDIVPLYQSIDGLHQQSYGLRI